MKESWPVVENWIKKSEIMRFCVKSWIKKFCIKQVIMDQKVAHEKVLDEAVMNPEDLDKDVLHREEELLDQETKRFRSEQNCIIK